MSLTRNQFFYIRQLPLWTVDPSGLHPLQWGYYNTHYRRHAASQVNTFPFYSFSRLMLCSVTHMYLTAAATFPIAWIGMELYSTTSVTSLPLSWLWNTLAVICIFPGLLLYRSHLEPDTIALTLSPEEMEAASLLDNASESLIRYS